MKMKMVRILTGLTALMAGGAAVQAQYTFTTLDCPMAAGNGTQALRMEGANVVGLFWDTNVVVHGFLYTGGTNWTTLDDPLASSDYNQGTYASSISGGHIVGYYNETNGLTHGFLYDGTNWTTLDDPLAGSGNNQGTWAFGISGTNIVGQYIDAGGTTHAFLYNGTVFRTIDPPGSVWALASDISGTNIVGGFGTGGDDIGFLYNGINYRNISDPRGARGTACNGISGGSIVGVYWDASVNPHGFVYMAGLYTTLDDPLAAPGQEPNGGTYPIGISGNTISGLYYDAPTNWVQGFLATPTNLSMTISRAANLSVSWPYPSLGWTLQQNPDLTTTNWTDSPATVSSDATNNSVTIVPSAPGNMFFRLVH